jgi:hypothetical protein
MPYDYTMCPGGACPLRRDCYRYRAIILGRQDFFGTPPFDAPAARCDHYAPLRELDPSEETIRTRAYFRWQSAGSPDGDPTVFWLAAKAELEAARDALLAPSEERP